MDRKVHHKRRIKVIKPKLQLKLVSIFVGMAALAVLLQTILVAYRLTNLATELPGAGPYITDALPGLLLEIMIFTVGLVLPLIFAVGILVTHRIAGPVYRFEQHLSRVGTGEAVERCRLRKGDELQDLCDVINLMLERLQGAPERDREERSVAELSRAG